MKRRYQPWAKGPAEIIPFPVRLQRAWLICLVEGERYRGEVFGDPVEGPTMTGEGPRDLVLAALQRPENRRGFPDHDGLASLCVPCHSAKTARGIEAGAARTTRPRKGCDANGRPLDPAHPWKKSLRADPVGPPTHLKTQLVSKGN